jgi:hypothetical protein
LGRHSDNRFERRDQCGTALAQLVDVLGGEFLQNPLAVAGEGDYHLTAVALVLEALDKSVPDHAVDQFDCTVMADLQALGEVSDRGTLSRVTAESFGGQKKLVMLRFHFTQTRRLFAEMEEPANMITEIG